MSAITQELSALAGFWVIQPSTVTVPNGTTGVQLVAASPLRWGLAISLPSAGLPGGAPLVILPVSAPSASFGIELAPRDRIEWDYRHHPGLVQCGWLAFNGGAAPATVTVIQELAQQ